MVSSRKQQRLHDDNDSIAMLIHILLLVERFNGVQNEKFVKAAQHKFMVLGIRPDLTDCSEGSCNVGNREAPVTVTATQLLTVSVQPVGQQLDRGSNAHRLHAPALQTGEGRRIVLRPPVATDVSRHATGTSREECRDEQ